MENKQTLSSANLVLVILTGGLLILFIWLLINSISQQIMLMKESERLQKDIQAINYLQKTHEKALTPIAIIDYDKTHGTNLYSFVQPSVPPITKQNNFISSDYLSAAEQNVTEQLKNTEAKKGWGCSVVLSMGVWLMGVFFSRVVNDYCYPWLRGWVIKIVQLVRNQLKKTD